MLERKSYVQRPGYMPASPHEAFIVPLLKREIDGLLSGLGAPRPGESRALDVGCGRQPFRPALEELGYRYLSTDVEQNPEGTTDFICEIDRTLPAGLVDGEGFDLIFCTEVLEHVADWDATFANFAKILNPGGKVLLTCPHFYMLHLEPHDFWRPTPHAFRFFADRHGFRVGQSKTAGDAWDILGTVLASTYSQPKSPTLWSRLVSRCYWTVHRALLKSLMDGSLRRNVTIESRFTLYQSNIVLLEKP